MGVGPPYLNSGDPADRSYEAAHWITSALAERLGTVMGGGVHLAPVEGFFGTPTPSLDQWKDTPWDQIGGLFDYKRGGIQRLIETCIDTVSAPWGGTHWIWDDAVWWNGSREGSEYDLGQSTILDDPPEPYFGGPEYNLKYNLTMANPYLAPPGYHTGQEISVLNPFPPAYGWWDVTKYIDKETIAPGVKARYSIPHTAAFFNQMMWFLDQLQDWVWYGKWDFSPENTNQNNMGIVPFTWTRSTVSPADGIPWVANSMWSAHLASPKETYVNDIPRGFQIEQQYYYGNIGGSPSHIGTTVTTDFPFTATKRLPGTILGTVERTRCYTNITGYVYAGPTQLNPFNVTIGEETYTLTPRAPGNQILDVTSPPAGSFGNNINVDVEGDAVTWSITYPPASILQGVGGWFLFTMTMSSPGTYIKGNLAYSSGAA